MSTRNSKRERRREQEEEEKEEEEEEEEEEEDSMSASEKDVDEDEGEEELQNLVSEIPFEDLQRARCDGFSRFRPIPIQKPIPSRANKNRPVEMSSKKPVGRFREVIQAPKRVLRDPRFENLCGGYEESRFKKSYSFLYDEELPAEKKRLQGLLRKEKSSEVCEQIEKHINWIDTQLREEEKRRKRHKKDAEVRKKEKEAVKQGKKPFYLKKSETRKEDLIDKYKELKASGKLDAFLAKRRRKNASKDHRYIPYRRSHE